MPAARLFLASSLALAAAAALAACAQNGGATLPTTTSPLAMRDIMNPNAKATPPPCQGQKTTKNYGSASEKLSSKGGDFCLPSINGFGGTMEYPKVNPSVKVKVTGSTTNYAKLPELGTGTAIYYLQMTLASGATFGKNIQPSGGLTSATIKTGKPYTAYGEATISGAKVKFGPCFSDAVKGKYGGEIPAIGALFEYAELPSKTNAFLEVYSGKQTNTQC